MNATVELQDKVERIARVLSWSTKTRKSPDRKIWDQFRQWPRWTFLSRVLLDTSADWGIPTLLGFWQPCHHKAPPYPYVSTSEKNTWKTKQNKNKNLCWNNQSSRKISKPQSSLKMRWAPGRAALKPKWITHSRKWDWEAGCFWRCVEDTVIFVDKGRKK